MTRFVFILIPLLITIAGGYVSGQGNLDLPAYSQGSIKHLNLSDGLPDKCVDRAFIDKEGRLWLVNCDYVQIQQGLNLYQFDGYRARSVQMSLENASGTDVLRFVGFDRLDRLYGYVVESQTFFFYHAFDDSTEEYDVGVSDPSEVIVSMILEEGVIYVTTLSAEHYSIYRFEDKVCSKVADIPRDPKLKTPDTQLYRPDVRLLNSEIWIWEAWHPVYRLSLATKEIRQYHIPGYSPRETIPHKWTHRTQLAISPQNELWLYSSESDQGTYYFDQKEDKILPLNIIPEQWSHIEPQRTTGVSCFYTDEMGNILISYLNSAGEYTVLMQDREGNMHNYTPVLKGIDLGTIVELSSYDFREFVQKIGTPYAMVEVQSSEAITSYPFGWTRGIAEFRSNELIVFAKNNIAIDLNDRTMSDGEWFMNICESEMLPDGEILRDKTGILWTLGRVNDSLRSLNMYDPMTGFCETFNAPAYSSRFGPIDERTIAIAADSILYFYDLQKHSYELVGQNGQAQRFDGLITDIVGSRNRTTWITTASGLWKIVRSSTDISALKVHEASSSRLTTLHESQDGKLWIGTFLEGVIIYDPATNNSRILNRDRGLSHNAVASILEDNNGRIWIGTYFGITVVSPEGEILTKIYKKDGLVDNECNRWSSYKMMDGRLIFGSVSGISVIDPERLLRNSKTNRKLSIVFTSARYFDDNNNREVELSQPVDFNQTLVLNADNRSLQLSFSLSDYFNVESHNFAYMIEGHDDDWNFIGNTHNLNLNSLPAGKYNIVVKGSDSRGNWTSESIRISLEVKEFFYLHWWFYVLCTLPFIVIGVVWIWRQKKTRHNLEIEIAQRTHQIRNQAEELKKMDQIKSRLYTNITHEFRTPLTVIMGLIDQIREQKPPSKIDANLGIVERNSASLLNLVNQMLDLRKLESDSMPIAMVQGNVVRHLQYLSESFRSLAEAKNTGFHFLADQDELMMDYDPEKMQRIVSNLLSNAIKFTPEGGDVYLQIGSASVNNVRSLEIKVRDTGIGIPPDQVDHVFDQFYQADDSETRMDEGTGIGLTLVAEIVKLLKGKISVESNQSKGTTFSIQLPITNVAPLVMPENLAPQRTLIYTDSLSKQSPIDIDAAHAGDSQLPILLLVEDNADVIHFLVSTLSKDYQIKIAMNGQEGIDKAVEVVPDLILSDVMMPVRDGFDLCETLKTDVRTSHIPIVLLTAKADVESRISGLKHGADAYLAKPFNKEELLIQLEQLLRLRQMLQKKYIEIEDLPSTTPIEGKEASQLESDFLLDIRRAVEKHLDEVDFGVMQLCHAMNLSRAQLHRKVKALTSRSTSAYIRLVRLHKSRELLRDESHNVSEVAYAVGFSDPLYFSRVFKEEFGVSPSEFQVD